MDLYGAGTVNCLACHLINRLNGEKDHFKSFIRAVSNRWLMKCEDNLLIASGKGAFERGQFRAKQLEKIRQQYINATAEKGGPLWPQREYQLAVSNEVHKREWTTQW